MSTPSTSRLVLRQFHLYARQQARRHASTAEAASNAASKSKEAAFNVTSKASQGLSRVTTSAGPALSGAAQGVQKTLGRIGGRTGRLISFAESLVPPTIYYSKVGFELSKLVFKGQKMNPPNAAAFQEYISPLLHAIRNPTRLQNLITDSAHSLAGTAKAVGPEGILNRVRNMSTKDMISVGVLGAELLGFFTVGEIIGKFKVVGYRGDAHPHATTATPH